jgi:thioredoxin-like negative regulator of GroEL
VRHILYFTAEWCNPCKKVKPIVEELNRESADTRFQIVDADSEIDLVKSFEVRSIPTFILIEDGKEIKRVSGAQTKDQLQGLMSYG